MKSLTLSLSLIAAVAVGFVSPAFIPVPAVADIAAAKAVVDAAKGRGEVGEGRDGLLASVHGSLSPAVQSAVDEINAGRQAAYGQLASKNNVPVEAAGQSAYTNIILPKLQPGQYYQEASGAWVRK